MDPKPQKPSFLFASPFSLWTDFALKLWGFGTPRAPSSAPEKQVAVAVIPSTDAQPTQRAKAVHAHSSSRRAKSKVRSKRKSKRARR